MKLLLAGLVLILIVETHAQWYWWPVEAAQGAYDMAHAYLEMREANHIGADLYFHAKGNRHATLRGPGGRWAGKLIGDAREGWQGASGRGHDDTAADQEANRCGRNLECDYIRRYRPENLDPKY